MFAEATYNHVPPLEKMQQPLLAIWGSNDRTAPPAESFHITKETLERGGNKHVTLQFIPDANHDLRWSPDGFVQTENLAPGYAEAMVSWIENVIEGEEEAGINVIGDIPQQKHTSFARLFESSWYESAWSQLVVMVILVAAFSSFYGIVLIRLFRKSQVKSAPIRLHWYAGIIAVLGIVSTLGFFGYLGYIMMTSESGPLVMGRPVFWLVLQFLSIITSMFAVLLAVSWSKIHFITDRLEKMQLQLALIGGMLFIPWAFYWKLLYLLV